MIIVPSYAMANLALLRTGDRDKILHTRKVIEYHLQQQCWNIDSSKELPSYDDDFSSVVLVEQDGHPLPAKPAYVAYKRRTLNINTVNFNVKDVTRRDEKSRHEIFSQMSVRAFLPFAYSEPS
jgi:hypothetical protein